MTNSEKFSEQLALIEKAAQLRKRATVLRRKITLQKKYITQLEKEVKHGNTL